MWARKAAAAAGCIAGLSYGPLVSAEEKGAVPPPAVSSFLDAVGNTPLIELRGLSKATGCRIYGKAEYLNPGGSVKDRAAAGMIAAAEAAGQLVPAHASPDGVAHGTIVEGTGGNTGLALALAARSRGYTCILTVPDRITAEKKDSMRLFGATLIECPSVPFSDPRHFFHEASRLAAATPGAVWTDQFNNAANWGAHYSTTGPEIWAQTGGQVDAVALASGTGGTIGGLATFFSEQSKDVAVFLVDPPGSSLKGLLDTGAFLPLPGSTITEGIGTGRHTLGFDTGRPHLAGAVAVRDADAVQMAHFLLSQEGIFVGPAAAMNAMGAAMVATKLGPGHTIVTILCDSGDKYRSTVYSQAYLQDRGLEAVASAGADGTLPDIGSALAFSESNPQPRKE